MVKDGSAFQMTREELFAELGKRSSHFKHGFQEPISKPNDFGRFVVNVGTHHDISMSLRYPELLIGYESIPPTFYLLEVLAILIELKHTAEARALAAFFFRGIYFTEQEWEAGRGWVSHYFPELAEFKGDFGWLIARNQMSTSFDGGLKIWTPFILIPLRGE